MYDIYECVCDDINNFSDREMLNLLQNFNMIFNETNYYTNYEIEFIRLLMLAYTKYAYEHDEKSLVALHNKIVELSTTFTIVIPCVGIAYKQEITELLEKNNYIFSISEDEY